MSIDEMTPDGYRQRLKELESDIDSIDQSCRFAWICVLFSQTLYTVIFIGLVYT